MGQLFYAPVPYTSTADSGCTNKIAMGEKRSQIELIVDDCIIITFTNNIRPRPRAVESLIDPY